MIRYACFALLAFPALTLAACSKQPAPAPSESGSMPAPTPAQAKSATSPTVTATPQPASDIPAAVRGRWGLVRADCTSTRGDAKGLLTIDATSLMFYESVGKLAALKERGNTRLRGTFAFSGEGMDWTRDEVLDVQDGGKTLVRREYGEDAQPGPLRYTKCG